MAIPPIAPLPQAPSRSDGPVAFNALADPFIAALPPFVLQANALGAAINEALISMGQGVFAAAGSATAAAASATAANASKVAAAQSAIDATDNGEAQVVLAANQVTLAVNAKNSAEVAAAAAQSAAGLPSLAGNAYKVLRVNTGATGVEWGLGLPPVAGVTVGKSLVVGAGNTVGWVEQDKIGDILISARNPGSLWLPADGSIRAQSSYPVLFAALGILGSNVGQAWSSVSTGASIVSVKIASNEAGIVIALNNDGSVSRSTDYGATFTLQPTTRGYTQSIATDGSGTWVITTAAIAGTAYRSTDEGLTWGSITLPTTTASGWSKAVYAGNNVWLAIASNTANVNIARSTNGGATWSNSAHGLGSVTLAEIGADKNTGVCLFSSGTTVRRSTDYGATWATVLTSATVVSAMANDGAGTWLISGGNGVTNTYLSKNNGVGFALTPMPANVNVSFMVYANQTFFLHIASVFPYTYVDSLFSQIGTAPSGITNTAHAGKGILVGIGSTAGNVSRSLPYSYDPVTQFQLPRQPVALGLTAYIKALEAA